MTPRICGGMGVDLFCTEQLPPARPAILSTWEALNDVLPARQGDLGMKYADKDVLADMRHNIESFAEIHGLTTRAAEIILDANGPSKRACDAAAGAFAAAAAFRNCNGSATGRKGKRLRLAA